MPANSSVMACWTATASPPRSLRAPRTRSASPPASSGSGSSGRSDPLVAGAMEDRVAHSGVVFLAERGQDHRLGELGANEALALEHGPHRRVAQTGCVARGN